MDLPQCCDGGRVMSAVLLAFSTFPDEATARRIAEELVNQNSAACANILPQVHSIYRWKGNVEHSDEALVLFKIAAARYPDFEAQLRAAHPYDTPEIIAVPIEHGAADYVRWIIDNSG